MIEFFNEIKSFCSGKINVEPNLEFYNDIEYRVLLIIIGIDNSQDEVILERKETYLALQEKYGKIQLDTRAVDRDRAGQLLMNGEHDLKGNLVPKKTVFTFKCRVLNMDDSSKGSEDVSENEIKVFLPQPHQGFLSPPKSSSHRFLISSLIENNFINSPNANLLKPELPKPSM